MNYSETYFKWDSEEATLSHPLSPIVTLSVVCTLKGMCHHTLFDLGGVEILKYKRSKQCQRCQRFQDFKCYVCQRCRRWCLWLLCNTAYRVLLLISLMSKTSKMPNTIVLCIVLCLFIWAFHPVGLAVHHYAVWGGTFVLKCSGTCQTTRVIAGKTHSQSPILKTKGCAATW